MIGIWLLCTLAWATDGDTLGCRDTNGTEHAIRIRALHAPELRDDGGPEARSALADLVSGQWLTCLPNGRSFHRLVADCQVRGDRDLAAAMIETGRARHCPRYGRDDLLDTPDNGLAIPEYCR